MTEQMDDLTEKVARAICKVNNENPEQVWHGQQLWKAWHEGEARAAIRAVLDGIREPDDAMKKAGKLAGDVDDLDHTPSEIEAIFAAMIDELRRRYD